MVTALRSTLRETGTLARTVGLVLKAQWHSLLLLFILGWAAYHLTAMAAGFLAPRWTWGVIPLMGVGALAQLLVTLAAYRLCIRAAETTLDAPRLPDYPFRELVSRLLVPFAAAYSAFGFFNEFARDSLLASEALVGTMASTAFIANINPVSSPRTLTIVVVTFITLWIAARLFNGWSARRDSMALALLGALAASCSTLLGLFSAFRLWQQAGLWLQSRAFMGWRANALAWLGDLVDINLPAAFDIAWAWLSDTAWPIFWYALSQPILWLGVIALVGGMQFLDVDTVWARLRRTRGLRGRVRDGGIADRAGHTAVEAASGALPLLHLVSVILKAGVPFLGAFVVLFTVIERGQQWLQLLIDKVIGPVPSDYTLLLLPLGMISLQVIGPLLTAVLLAAAYVRLRLDDESLGFNRPSRPSWRSALVGLLCIAVATALSAPQPGSADRIYRLTEGEPTTIMGMTVVVDDLRVGWALDGIAEYRPLERPIPSEGVFVAVRVSLTGHDSTSVQVKAQVGDTSYPTWDNTSRVFAGPGYMTTMDLVFDLPPDSLDSLTVTITPRFPMTTTLGVGWFVVPDGVAVEPVITVDVTRIVEVP